MSLVAIAVGLCHPTASQLVSEHVIVSGDIVSGDGNVPLKSIQTSGRMSAGSNQLIFAAPAGFQVGDGIIVETGGEAGRGARGTVGVGGVWPALSYASVTAMNSDRSHPANTFAWIRDGSGASGTVGDVYQWSGSSWIYTGLDFSYYFNKAIPKALVGYVCTVANGGTTLTLATQTTSCRTHPFNAAVATSGANVYYDNATALQEIWGTVNPNFTYVMPSGSYAIGSEIDIGGGSPSTPLNSTIAGQGGYPTCNTTLFSPDGATSATINANVYTFTFRDFCITGNSRQAGYGADWQRVSETSVKFPWGIELGIYLDPSGTTTVRNMTFLNTWGAVGAEASDNITVQNVSYTAQDPVLVEQWAFACSDTDVGCSFSNISVTSNSGLTPGFACFRTYYCAKTNVTSVNGLFDFNSSGRWTVQGANITITPSSADIFSVPPGPVVAITTNISDPEKHAQYGGQFNNFKITEQGYVDAGNNLMYGIELDGNVPNVTIDADGSSSTYSAPNCGTGARYGAVAFSSDAGAPQTIANNMIVSGKGCSGETNFQFTPGKGDQCNNCTGSIRGLP